MLQLYSNHTGNSIYNCSWRAILQNMTVLGNLVIVVTFPMYVWLIYSVLRRCIPRTFIRIWIGEVLLIAGMTAMFLVDMAGHVKHYSHYHQAAACMFRNSGHNHSFNLDLPWAVNLLPVLLVQAGIAMVITTIFEFISAQSPHSMKGLLIGVFYAVRGMFKFLGVISMLPFSLRSLWESKYMQEHTPSITNCGFGYFLLNCVVGLIGLILFSVCAKRYRYRERNDPPFNQMNIERVWANT